MIFDDTFFLVSIIVAICTGFLLVRLARWSRTRTLNDSSYLHLKGILGPHVPSMHLDVADIGVESDDRLQVIDFVYVLVEEKDVVRFCDASRETIRLAERFNAIVVANASGLIQITFDPGVENKSGRIELVSSLLDSARTAVRIVHGNARSRVGILGLDSRKNWGVFPLAFSLILIRLVSLEPGQAFEFDGTPEALA